MRTRLLAALFASTLGGCASSLGTFFNRPVVEDNIANVASTVSLAADRRTVVVSTAGSNAGKFCAEPPPDTATGLKAELDASVEAKFKSEKAKAEAEGKIVLKDKFDSNVTVLAERTAELDAYRTGVYALCQYHLNGAISGADLKELFKDLMKAFFDATKKPGT